MRWWDIHNGSKLFDMQHLHPFTIDVLIDGEPSKIHVTFGLHVFTDEKANGVEISFRDENRYFCPERYNLSLELPKLISDKLLTSYVAAYHNKKRKECYFYLDMTDFGVFMEVRKPPNTTNELRLHIVSAYELDEWGRSGLPKGNRYKFSYVLAMRAKGQAVIKKRRT